MIWRENTPIGDLPAIFQQIRSLGLQVMLATNNSTRSGAMYVKRLAQFGVQVEPWQVINSAQRRAAIFNNCILKAAQYL